jgi:cytidylate kinase
MSSRPATLVFIFGPAAVGKMTVGQELAKLTGFKLLYNHMVIDVITEFFPFGTPAYGKLTRSWFLQIMEAAAQERLSLIVTFSLAFFQSDAKSIIDELSAKFREAGMRVCYAELAAPLETRIARNETANRRAHKKVDWSTPERLREIDAWGRWNSAGDFPYPDDHLFIDNTDVSAAEAASMIRERFGL